MLRYAVIPMLLVLAACATPLEQCLNEAARDVRAIERELTDRRVALARGYTVERIPVPRMVPSVCGGPGVTPYACMRMEQDYDEIHHRINPELERERIALLERQLDRESRRAAEAQAQCRVAHPA